MRLELPDGQWAELRDRLTYGQARDVRRVALAIRSDDSALADLDMAYVRAYVSTWFVRDIEGEAVPVEAAEQAPDDIIQAIAAAAVEVWARQGNPKASAKTSRTTLKALG